MAERGYEYYDHTADVGIRAWGPTLEAAFEEAARGLVANMVDTEHAVATEERTLDFEGESLERLLFVFLDEVLFLFQTEGFVALSATVELLGERRLRAHLRGEGYDALRHGHVHEIKAVTYHDLAVSRAPPEVRLVVDI